MRDRRLLASFNHRQIFAVVALAALGSAVLLPIVKRSIETVQANSEAARRAQAIPNNRMTSLPTSSASFQVHSAMSVDPGPGTSIKTVDDWTEATEGQRSVLFVDADCNGWVLAYRKRYEEYSEWYLGEYDKRVLFVDTSPTEESLSLSRNIDQDLFDKLQQLWETHRVPTGALKSVGGAGTVAWMVDGAIVDHEFVGAFESVQEMIDRTNAAFQSDAIAR